MDDILVVMDDIVIVMAHIGDVMDDIVIVMAHIGDVMAGIANVMADYVVVMTGIHSRDSRDAEMTCLPPPRRRAPTSATRSSRLMATVLFPNSPPLFLPLKGKTVDVEPQAQ